MSSIGLSLRQVCVALGALVCRIGTLGREMTDWLLARGGRILLSLIALVLLYAYAGDILIYLAPSTTLGYALKYDVAESMVVVDKRPHNCDWNTAPLGAKHCHYEVQVQWTRTAMATGGAPPLVSYDGGKTWTQTTAHVEPSVSVSWIRVEE